MTELLRNPVVRRAALLAVSVAGLTPVATSQRLVADLDQTPINASPGSFASDFAPLGNRYLFTANTATGKQIHVTDGTPAGTFVVSEANQQTVFLQPQLTDGAELNGVRYFRCLDFEAGYTVWQSDGTLAGTRRFFDPDPTRVTSGGVQSFAAAAGKLFFAAETPAHGWELWVSDGTAANTTVLDATPGPSGARIHWATPFASGIAYSRGNLGAWFSDGTLAGTFALTSGTSGSYPQSFFAFGNRLFFGAGDASVGQELWVSDGTPSGTRGWIDLNPGPGSSSPTELIGVGNRFFFCADDGSHGRELFVSDGTVAGTGLLADLIPGAVGSDPSDLTPFGTGFLFAAAVGQAGNREPWFSDGTAAGTIPLAELQPGIVGSDPDSFTTVAVGGYAAFRANTAATGRELFVTDGTPQGTRLGVDFRPGAADGLSFRANWEFGVIGSRVVLGPDDGVHGEEPWVSDGTPAGSQLLLDIARFASGSAPRSALQLGDRCLFSATDPVHGSSLFSTDGTTAGTARVLDGNGEGYGVVGPLFRFGDHLFFNGRSGTSTTGLFRTDGTAAGTSLVLPFTGFGSVLAQERAVVDDRLFLLVGADLFVSDGTAGGTSRLKTFPISFPFGAAPNGLTAFAGRVFLSAEDAAGDVELWVSDGTTAGTVRFVDLRVGGSSSPRDLTVSGGQLFFVASDDATGTELYVSDGTVAGTGLFRELRPGPDSGYPRDLIDAAGRLFFLATGDALWTSDGTVLGTRFVADVNPNSAFEMGGMTAFGDRLLFSSEGRTTGREPWISDGTALGTTLLADIFPGTFHGLDQSDPEDESLFQVVGSGRVALFAADDGVHGVELWRTDGTAAGTRRLSDIDPGLANGSSTVIGRCGATVYLAARTLDLGEELWAMPLLDSSDSLAAPYGHGCAGTMGRPRLTGSGAPFVGNPTFALEVSNALPGTGCLVLLNVVARERAVLGAGGCLLYPVIPAVSASLAVDHLGTATLPLAVPNDPALRGLELFGQAAAFDPAGAWDGVFALSNGLHLLIGD